MGAGVYGQPVGRRLRISLGKYATVLQAEIYAILSCAYEIQMNVRPEKSVSICTDSQVALKVLQAAKTMCPLVQQCLKVLNVISTQYTVGLLGSLGLLEYKEMKLLTSSQEMFLFKRLLDLTHPRQNIRRKIKAGWITIIWQGGKVLVVLRDKLEN